MMYRRKVSPGRHEAPVGRSHRFAAGRLFRKHPAEGPVGLPLLVEVAFRLPSDALTLEFRQEHRRELVDVLVQVVRLPAEKMIKVPDPPDSLFRIKRVRGVFPVEHDIVPG